MAEEFKSQIEDLDGITVIRGGGDLRHWNGIHYKEGLSAKNVNAKALSINIATIPPGGVAKAHIHDGFEVMLYIISGRVRHEYGPGLTKIVDNDGDVCRVCVRSRPDQDEAPKKYSQQ